MKVIFKNRIILFVLFNCLAISHSFGQKLGSVKSNQKDSTTFYRQNSFGLSIPTFRDFATSPLFYSGAGLDIQKGWLKRSDQRERSLTIGATISATFAQIPESDYLQANSVSTFSQINASYTQLWKVNARSNANNNMKLGGTFITSQNNRQNSHLMNAGLGVENISNVMVTGQIIRDISRKESRHIHTWFFNKTLNPVKRDLRFLMNVGILNFNYRPGYAYAYMSEFNGTQTTDLSWILSNYSWKMNGYRFNTELEYITYMPNGNARSWSYKWDVAHAPGNYEAFQMAAHRISYTYYFQTKKRDNQ